METYATYKFYDEKGRRLAIFGRLVSDGAIEKQEGGVTFTNLHLQIYVVTCSNKDRFNKRKANLIFNGRSAGESEKGEFLVALEDAGKPKWTFIKWCEDNYYKPTKVTFEFEGKVLVKGKGDDADCLDGIEPVSPLRVKEGLYEL